VVHSEDHEGIIGVARKIKLPKTSPDNDGVVLVDIKQAPKHFAAKSFIFNGIFSDCLIDAFMQTSITQQ